MSNPFIISAQTDLQTFNKYGISLQYPSDWQTIETLFAGSTVVQFISPIENNNDLFIENINIVIQELDDKSIEEIIDEGNEIIQQFFENVQITDKKTIDKDGILIHQTVYSVSETTIPPDSQNIDISILENVFIKDNNVFTITAASDYTKVSQYNTLINNMINSLKFENQNEQFSTEAGVIEQDIKTNNTQSVNNNSIDNYEETIKGFYPN